MGGGRVKGFPMGDRQKLSAWASWRHSVLPGGFFPSFWILCRMNAHSISLFRPQELHGVADM